MLRKSDTNIAGALAVFAQYDLDVGLLVPTETGMDKSIMDATASLRDYFRNTGFHDYDAQAQGPDAKVIREAFFVRPNELQPTKASLYRPKTKSGDPRIWFGQLKRYAEPYNLLAVLVHENTAYIINCSDQQILNSIHDPSTPLGKIAAPHRLNTDPVVGELLDMIRKVSARGFVRTLRSGDTGVGMTLETLLGIKANTRKVPDYKGIELKAKRLGRNNRVTLFSQAPDWKLSPIGSAWDLLDTYGYERDGKRRLYHEMNAIEPNSIGFILEVDSTRDWLKQNYVDPDTAVAHHLTTWQMEKLRTRLKEKHPRTFWVGARCRGKGANEEFHYVEVEYTREPRVQNFDTLIEAGVISVDYTLSQKERGVRDHGYLFKMHEADFPALFPLSEKYVFA